MPVVFRQESERPPLFDLVVDGRSRGYDIAPDDFQDAIRRARLTPQEIASGVFVEDMTGYRERLSR